VIELSKRAKKTVGILSWKNHEDLRGVNDLWELAQASQRMNEKVIKKWAIFGVKVIDPVNTRIDVSVELAEGVTIHPESS